MTVDSSSPVQVPTAGAYRVDPGQSTARYRGRHLFGLGTVHATFAVPAGEVQVRVPVVDSTVVLEVDPASFSSGNAKRDRDVVAASLLDCATHPEIRFTSTGLRQQDAGDWVLSGTVTAHGTTVPVDVVIDRLTPEEDGMRVHARAEHLDRYAFGVTGSKGMVGRHLDLDFDVLARRV
jgi:polyisoprenoid-binding protein YceI